MQSAKSVVLCAAAVASSIAHADVTIGFDNLPDQAIVSDQYRSLGVVFEGNWQVQGPGPFNNAVSPLNSIAFYDPSSLLTNYTVAANFVVPGTSIQASTHSVSFTPTDASASDTLCSIRAYNAGGFEIAHIDRLVDGSGIYSPVIDTPLIVIAPAGQTIVRVELSVARNDGNNRVIEGDDFHFGDLVIPPCGPADIGSIGGTPGPDHILDNNDFIVYIDLFFNNDPSADRGSIGGEPGSDGIFDNNDFIVYIDQFFTGC